MEDGRGLSLLKMARAKLRRLRTEVSMAVMLKYVVYAGLRVVTNRSCGISRVCDEALW